MFRRLYACRSFAHGVYGVMSQRSGGRVFRYPAFVAAGDIFCFLSRCRKEIESDDFTETPLIMVDFFGRRLWVLCGYNCYWTRVTWRPLGRWFGKLYVSVNSKYSDVRPFRIAPCRYRFNSLTALRQMSFAPLLSQISPRSVCEIAALIKPLKFGGSCWMDPPVVLPWRSCWTTPTIVDRYSCSTYYSNEYCIRFRPNRFEPLYPSCSSISIMFGLGPAGTPLDNY